MTATHDPFVLTVTEAAKALRIGRTKCWELIRDERLRAIRIDGRTVVPLASINAFVNERLADTRIHTTGPTAA